MRFARAGQVVATFVAVLAWAPGAGAKASPGADAAKKHGPAAASVAAVKARSLPDKAQPVAPSAEAPPGEAVAPTDGAPRAAKSATAPLATKPAVAKVAAAKPAVAPAAAPALVDGPAAAPVEPLGPGPGPGDRHVSPGERPRDGEPSRDREPTTGGGVPAPARHVAESVKPQARSYKVGRPPKQPRPTLPDGVTPPSPDGDARRQIAGGPTSEDASGTKGDPELRELGLAERVLFPRPLPGARAGWAWDLPSPVDDGAASIEASGLPRGTAFAPAVTPAEATREAEWLRSLAMPNLPTRLDSRVVKYLKFYRDDPRGRSILRIWARKSGRLAPALKAELAKAGLPTDLVWLSLIESGHNPTIVSPVGAAGLWQFIPESARMYGLTVDRWVDERLDPERATEAAVRYLTDLRTRFGSWELAMAAYNMGHGGLLRVVRKFNTNDFWALSRYEAGLPWETTLYVPKILATAIAMANKKAFGIDDVEQEPPISFDTVSVGPNVDLSDVARAAEVTVEEVRALNASYLSGRTPPVTGAAQRWPVRVPSGRGMTAQQRLAETPRRAALTTEPHVVRFGDTLETIASEYGTSVRELSQRNHVAADERLKAGSVIFVPGASSADASSDPPPEEVIVVPARRFGDATRRRVFYRVLPGDQAADVAQAFGVSPSELALWNALDQSAQLQPGMTLQVLVRPELDLSRVRCLREHEVRVLIAGSEEFFDHFEAQNGRKRLTVTAKKGDTLASIGRKYGMSTAMMERINRVPASSPIDEGDKIIVYAKSETGGARHDAPDLARELSAIAAPMPDLLPPLIPGPAPANGLRTVTP
jgi:membrane-bound lytic murein transglycosylase D